MKNRIYIARTEELKNDVLFGRLYSTVSRSRREKIDRMVFNKDKRLSLAAGLLLVKALRDMGTEDYSVVYGKNGKPYLKDKDIYFNLSHSEEAVMCAVSPCEIGCDTEKVTEIDLEIAKRFFYNKEYEMIISGRTDAEQQDMFFRLWTLKESFMKATGLGMELPLDSFGIEITADGISVRQNIGKEKYYFKEYNLNDGYKYAVCSLLPHFENEAELVTFSTEGEM